MGNEPPTIASLERALSILFALEHFPDGLTASKLAQKTGTSLSTLYRYVTVLSRYGILHYDGRLACYQLGNRLVSLANKIPAEKELVKTAFPHMQYLSREIGETVIITQVTGYEAICLERVESDTVVRLSFEKGAVLPLHAGASARVLMAYLSDKEVETIIKHVGLPRYTENTITDPLRLQEVLRQVRERGYAISDEEMDRGVRAISVPLFDSEGRAIAGLSVPGPLFRLDAQKSTLVLQKLRETAQKIMVGLPDQKAIDPAGEELIGSGGGNG